MNRPMTRAGLRSVKLAHYSWVIRPRALGLIVLLLAIAIGLTLFGVGRGSLPLTPTAVFDGLFPTSDTPQEWRHIVQDIRLPRLLMALLCGAMLGAAGAAMQSITRNGLADPGLIGVKEGCSVCVLLLIFQFPTLSLYWRPFAGMLGGGLTALIVVLLARDLTRPRFVLIGIGVSWACAAGLGVFMTTADVRDVQTALFWLSGSLHAANWPLLAIAATCAVPAFILLLTTARSADIALLGNSTAYGLGVHNGRLSLVRLLAPILLTAACVSCVGSIGFVGLMAPHIARFVLRGGQTALIIGSAVIGSLFVVLADNIGRLAFLPLQLPAGVVIAIIGGPFFLLLLWQRRDRL